MEYASKIIEFIRKMFIWWVVIVPWQQGVRVRGGKRVKVLGAGLHFRFPLYDQIYVQDTRMRVLQLPPQTITTQDGRTLTIVAAVGYAIIDIHKVFETLFQAESTLCNIVQGEIATYVAKHDKMECLPGMIETKCFELLSSHDFGISFDYLKITGFAEVRTYRLIQDQHWTPNSMDTSNHQ